MTVFPYKDPEINHWVYNHVPESMEAATSAKQLLIGTKILFKAKISSLSGCYIATTVRKDNRDCVLQLLLTGDIYVTKSGVSSK